MKPQAAQDQITLAVLTLLDDKGHVAGEDCLQRLDCCHAVIGEAELAREGGSTGADAVEIAHFVFMPASRIESSVALGFSTAKSRPRQTHVGASAWGAGLPALPGPPLDGHDPETLLRCFIT
jgi:hypothetical protein